MIQHDHSPTLRALHLLANHPEYVLTLETHESDDRSLHFLVSFHRSTAPLKLGAIASLTRELFVLRKSFKDVPMFVIENTPNDKDWEGFLTLFGFVFYPVLGFGKAQYQD